MAQSAGLVVRRENFADLQADNISFIRDDVLYVNTAFDQATQRAAIAREIGRRLVAQAVNDFSKDMSNVVPPRHLGETQPLPEVVHDFLCSNTLSHCVKML